MGAVVSTITLNGLLAAERLPAGSTDQNTILWLPSDCVGNANDHTPLALALAVTTVPPSRDISTRLPASALPLVVSVTELVSPSLVLEPVSGLITADTGASGAVRSTEKASAADKLDKLPARSVARALAVKAPSPSGGAITRVQSPVPSASVAPTLMPFTSSSTLLPASAEPCRPMEPVFVISALIAAPALLVRPRTFGATTEVSTSTVRLIESAPVLPALSLARAVNW